MAENFDLAKWNYWCDILSVNSKVLVSSVKWDDVTNALTGLKLCTKYEGYRYSCLTKALYKKLSQHTPKNNIC